MRRVLHILAAVLLPALPGLLLLPAAAGAQGTLGSQGFGYPPGQISTRSLGVGGATAEMDASSPLNPAALATWGRAGFYFQYDPEFRRVETPSARDNTTTIRFPVVAAALPVGTRGVIGLSASTLLDRTWATTSVSSARIGPDSVEFADHFRVTGAISDIRLGGSWALGQRFAVGLAGHALTGANRVSVAREFPDSARFSSLASSTIYNYSGVAASAGAIWRPARTLTLAGSARKGGTIRLKITDSLVSNATAPDRYGGAVSFSGIPGLALSARAEWNGWSRLNGLGSKLADAVDSWEYGAGGDIAGPHFATTPVTLRAGFHHRTLPFRANGAEVRETAFTGGFGFPLAGGRSAFDFAVQHAMRSASGDVRERAWTLSLGIAVRP